MKNINEITFSNITNVIKTFIIGMFFKSLKFNAIKKQFPYETLCKFEDQNSIRKSYTFKFHSIEKF